MVGALWTGISGLGGSQTGLDNESNNIANVNTIGYKASRVSFADQMYQDRIGKGVTSFDVEKMYTQGNLKNTGVSYDMALSGDGFFQVKSGPDTYYTRAGNFRMGEGGALEDVAQNKVQGWAIQPITDNDITATDPNAKFFTNDFTKLLGNKVIRDTTTIETIVAKATDYTTIAETDNNAVFTGGGYKSAATKIADVEMLITEYNSALSVYAEADPKPTASTSTTQKDLLNFPLTGSELAEGDEVYAYIDGRKYSVSFDTDNATTMKKFADKISDTSGFKAYLTGDTTSPFDLDTQTAPELGYLVVEGLVPGKQFRVTEFGWTDASNNNNASKGDVVTVQPSVLGTGMGHIDSIKDAMAEAVSGKQMDVYTESEIAFNETAQGDNDYTYQIEIYDNDLGQTVIVPASPLVLDNGGAGYDASTPAAKDASISAIAASINADPDLQDYVEAFNINGNLVVKTKDHNYDVEFTGSLATNIPVAEVQRVTVSGDILGTTATESLTFMGYTMTLDNSGGAFDTSEDVAAAVAANSANIVTAWNALNPTREIASVTNPGAPSATLEITYVGTEGNVSEILTSADNGVNFGESIEVQPGRAVGELPKNPNISGREGAGAEFLQIVTTINQTASKSELQLRLDTLKLTDSAFGDFKVDDTGMVTMTQDGARFAIGQIAVARFTDNRGLEPVGDNLLMETTRSGSALFNINNDKMAEIKGGTLELSTADLSESLVNLMVFQRAFEANAKSITTADTILNTLIQLKR
jgi:flagellar hook protein FlgE